jgi:hypothetical protein
MTDWKQKSRQEWTDANWATYLGCSVADVSKYRKIINEHYFATIEYDKLLEQYYFALYTYDRLAPMSKQYKAVHESGFWIKKEDAIIYGNNYISTGELLNSRAKKLNVPCLAIQLLTIQNKR